MTGGIKIVCEANLSSLGGLSEGMEDMYSLDKMTYSEPVKRNYVNLDTGGWADGKCFNIMFYMFLAIFFFIREI